MLQSDPAPKNTGVLQHIQSNSDHSGRELVCPLCANIGNDQLPSIAFLTRRCWCLEGRSWELAMRLVAAVLLYFAIVFGIGFLLGPIRVFWLEPWLGKTVAVLCESPLLLIAMSLAARWVPMKVGLRTDLVSLTSMGVGALVLQQIADFTVGITLRGVTPTEQLTYFKTPAGVVYGTMLFAFAVMPTLVNDNRIRR
jgi:hypothetical protein